MSMDRCFDCSGPVDTDMDVESYIFPSLCVCEPCRRERGLEGDPGPARRDALWKAFADNFGVILGKPIFPRNLSGPSVAKHLEA